MIDLFYRRPISDLLSREVFRYGVCGVGNYIVGDAVLYFFVYNFIVAKRSWSLFSGAVIVAPHTLSLIVIFPITFLIGFWLNRYVTFRRSEVVVASAAQQIVRYAFTVVGSFVLSYVVLKLLVEVVGFWPTPAKVTSSLATAIYSYLVARLYTFREEREERR